MEKELFLRESVRRRMATNGLGIILREYPGWLMKQGYSRDTIQQYTQAVEHFGTWRREMHPRSKEVLVGEVNRFLVFHLPRCHCCLPANKTLKVCRPALNALMRMLGQEKALATYDNEAGAAGAVISNFDQHMAKVCRLSIATRLYRRRYVCEFLAWRFKSKELDLEKLCLADVLTYVKFRARKL